MALQSVLPKSPKVDQLIQHKNICTWTLKRLSSYLHILHTWQKHYKNRFIASCTHCCSAITLAVGISGCQKSVLQSVGCRLLMRLERSGWQMCVMLQVVRDGRIFEVIEYKRAGWWTSTRECIGLWLIQGHGVDGTSNESFGKSHWR